MRMLVMLLLVWMDWSFGPNISVNGQALLSLWSCTCFFVLTSIYHSRRKDVVNDFVLWKGNIMLLKQYIWHWVSEETWPRCV